ncbi:C4-dicarboxylate ABC transporter [Halioglobus sp. HI00S01]|uniref:Na+/H+ antiporter NhaC family protein n=1 Tax=Halioglobus sp. HI00S01 TaxID=1822214 RepID=UPI0007C36A6A|nr:Na+/H+ antiporter NhaC family protein [Halioglobus sp. HI00S01]KZX57027.1 C4-dicarboxylate ABC transporter [Halioglobus sp. HI00S01]
MYEPGWTSLLPPLLAIGLALWSRQVYLALAGGIWLGATLLAGGNPLSGLADAIESIIAVLGNAGDARVIAFTLLIGALIATIEASGGVRGFIGWLESRRWGNSGKRAQWLAFFSGIVIFIESNITVLVAGTVARPLIDRYRVAREKLAYIIDSTSAPICILIPLNAWGAFNLSLLGNLDVDNPLGVFAESISMNFYAWFAVGLTALVIAFNWNIGPMREAEARAASQDPVSESDKETEGGKAINMVLPLIVLITTMPLGLWITGKGNLAQGSGSTSVLWAVLAALACTWLLMLGQRQMNVSQLMDIFLEGAGRLLPMAIILLLALALGDTAKALGTGPWVASQIPQDLAASLLLPAVFLSSAFIAFSVGSSWGTFAIMIPIAIPAGMALGLPPAPFLAAVLSGGIFGDHSSPISDTTVISSLASGSDHIAHVRTQLPYALLAGGCATAAFALLGMSI